ncbi:MAG: hypothetical protein U0797_01910 [Gemmataceae bacterium]
MRLLRLGVVALAVGVGAAFNGVADERGQALAPLVEGKKGEVVGTTGAMAVRAGVDILKQRDSLHLR